MANPADPHGAGRLGERVEVAFGRLDGREDGARVVGQAAAGRGESHATSVGLDQGGAGVAGQGGDLLGDRRGGQAVGVRHLAHRAESGELEEQVQASGVHVSHRAGIVNGRSRVPAWRRTVVAAFPGPMSTSTSAPRSLTPSRQGLGLAVTSMLCVQLGIGLSVGLFDRLGPEGTGWLRLVWAGVLMAALGRPWRLRLPRSAWAACVALGVGIAGLSLLFMAAAARIPLGTASAVEFLGPLAVAVVRGHGRHRSPGRRSPSRECCC